MKTWKLSVAKGKLSEVADLASAGEPQRITRAGKAPVIVISEPDLASIALYPVDDLFAPDPPLEDVISAIERTVKKGKK